jgi:hypothetical protein
MSTLAPQMRLALYQFCANVFIKLYPCTEMQERQTDFQIRCGVSFSALIAAAFACLALV